MGNKVKVVLMAGGQGKRIASLFGNIPKPLVPICDKPVLEREINCLKKQGFVDFIITLSYLSEMIIDYFGDGSKFGVHIQYYVEKKPLGTAGALFKIKHLLSDTFLLLNSDSIFDVDFNRFINYHHQKGGLVTIFTHPNSHPYDSGIIVTDSNGMVKEWFTKESKKPKWYKNRVNAGLHIIEKRLLDQKAPPLPIDLDRHLLLPLVNEKEVFAYDSTEYVKDMGTPDRYFDVCNDYLSGLVEQRNLLHKQKAIFIDRDGTINEYVGFLTNIDDFKLIEGVEEAIRKINASGYLAIVVTNQPVIARGDISIDDLIEIHNKMETLLGMKGAFLDAIFYCPHHPHSGYEGEVKELKIDCDCRKPKPGMLLKAAREYNIDLSKSWMIGDGESDIKAGKAAGCRTARIKDGKSLLMVIDEILC